MMNGSPLPAHGRWWDDSTWREAFDVFGEDVARAALAEVALYFTERNARRMTWRGGHPFLFDYLQRAGRDELILLGLGLQHLQPRRMRGRLLAAEHYVRAKAEIRVGVLLASLGMQLVHEPDGKDERGPDWLCHVGRDLSLRIEVKCPNWSRSAQLRATAVGALQHSFVIALGDVTALGVDTGMWLTIAPTTALVERIVRGGRVDDREAQRVASAGATQALGLGWPLADGRYEIADFGHIIVRRGAGEDPHLFFWGDPIPMDAEHEAARLRDVILEAAEQLRSDAAGGKVIAIDCANDTLVPSRRCVVEEVLREQWASHIAGALLVNDVSEGIRRRYAMHVVRGQAHSDAFEELSHRLADPVAT